jgi:hypothetical protein
MADEAYQTALRRRDDPAIDHQGQRFGDQPIDSEVVAMRAAGEFFTRHLPGELDPDRHLPSLPSGSRTTGADLTRIGSQRRQFSASLRSARSIGASLPRGDAEGILAVQHSAGRSLSLGSQPSDSASPPMTKDDAIRSRNQFLTWIWEFGDHRIDPAQSQKRLPRPAERNAMT